MAATTRTIQARVKIEGEKEYKDALTKLNTANKTLSSEMKKLKAEYQGNTDSMEYLTKKGEILDKQLANQKQKVNVLKDALAQAKSEFDVNSEVVQKWQKSLNDAEAELYNTQHAIEENSKAMEHQGGTVGKLGDQIDGLASKLGIKIPDGAKNALNGMQGFSAGTAAAMTAAVAAVAALAKTVGDLHELTIEAAADMDEVITESMTTGLSTKTIQQMKYAENLIDVSYGTITGALTKITRAMAEAKNGNEATARSFAELGVTIYDASTGQLRDAESVFYDVIDALGEVENQTDRDAAAMSLMGKSAQDLNPLILQGSQALKALGEEAEATGYILDESQVKQLGAVDDAYQRLQLQIEATKKELAVEFAPASEAALTLFAEVVKAAGEVLERSGIITNLSAIITSLLDILDTGGDILAGIPGFTSALDGLRQMLDAVALLVAAIADAAQLIKSILSLDFSGAANALGFGYGSGNANNIQRTLMQQQGTWGEYQSWYGHNAAGNDNWRGGLTYVGESGPELAMLPQGTRIYNAQDTAKLGGDTFYITIDAKSVREFNDIVKLAKSEQVRRRMK